MVGDQIYADMLTRSIPIGLADTFEEFQERYEQAFGSQKIRRLLRQLPTYMMLDDHEIEDNWTQDRIQDRKKRVLFQLAIGAYMSYQWVHSPRNFGNKLSTLSTVPNSLFSSSTNGPNDIRTKKTFSKTIISWDDLLWIPHTNRASSTTCAGGCLINRRRKGTSPSSSPHPPSSSRIP